MTELKTYKFLGIDKIYPDANLGNDYYLKAEVDAAIAELKEFAENACIERDDNQTAIDELQAENAELKAENERLKKQSSCTFSDDSLRVRQLKRKIADNSEKILELQKALDVALSEVYSLLDKIESLKASHYAEMVDAGMRERRLRRALYKACANWAKSERYTEATWHGDEHREELWANVQAKCREKAEEYK